MQVYLKLTSLFHTWVSEYLVHESKESRLGLGLVFVNTMANFGLFQTFVNKATWSCRHDNGLAFVSHYLLYLGGALPTMYSTRWQILAVSINGKIPETRIGHCKKLQTLAIAYIIVLLESIM